MPDATNRAASSLARKPRLLDLFCGAGGAAVGYAAAGFDVIGVDIEPQPNYPFEFHQLDAMAVLAAGGWWSGWPERGDGTHHRVADFDAIHASPPCQRWVGWQNIAGARGGDNDHPDLVTPLRPMLAATGRPYVIENGPNTPIIDPLTLCGSMFGLCVRRHRQFETNLPWKPTPPASCAHTGNEIGVYGKLDGRRLFTRADGTELKNPSSLEEAQRAMGIDWMTWDELREAIPPAYTQWLGSFLRDAIEVAA